MKDFYRQKGAESKKLYNTRPKIGLVIARLVSLGLAGVYQVDYLTGAGQLIPD